MENLPEPETPLLPEKFSDEWPDEPTVRIPVETTEEVAEDWLNHQRLAA